MKNVYDKWVLAFGDINMDEITENNFSLCPKCNNKTLKKINVQLRSLDEGQTSLEKCSRCDYKSRINS
jgi:DNA-directed RNA polymerase subunit M/transcription elongation factor TFIIS